MLKMQKYIYLLKRILFQIFFLIIILLFLSCDDNNSKGNLEVENNNSLNDSMVYKAVDTIEQKETQLFNPPHGIKWFTNRSDVENILNIELYLSKDEKNPYRRTYENNFSPFVIERFGYRLSYVSACFDIEQSNEEKLISLVIIAEIKFSDFVSIIKLKYGDPNEETYNTATWYNYEMKAVFLEDYEEHGTTIIYLHNRYTELMNKYQKERAAKYGF